MNWEYKQTVNQLQSRYEISDKNLIKADSSRFPSPLKKYLQYKNIPTPILIFVGALAGIISPFCLFGSIPILVSLKKVGLSLPVITAFLVSSPLMNPNLIVFSLVLGYELALARFLCAVIMGAGAGYITLLLQKKRNKSRH